MAAVRSETQQKMRSYSFELKYLIAGHIKAYQGEGQRWSFWGGNIIISPMDY